MIAHRHITKLVAVLMAAAVLLALLAVVWSDRLSTQDRGLTMAYETALFDTSTPMEIDILMDEDEWAEMLADATAEEWRSCDVTVNGTTYYNVGIRPKGNTSLTSIASDPTTDRYSFKLEFDHYVDGQTCCGLDKLVLNNDYADATNMKEALVYDMYQWLGVDASLYDYAEIHVNGSYWGVYLALEAVEDSFRQRNYGTENGALYKPDSMDMGDRGDPGDFSTPDDFDGAPPDFDGAMPQRPDGTGDTADGATGATAEAMPQPSDEDGDGTTGATMEGRGGPPEGGGFAIGGQDGATLDYTDDDLDSYSAIWDGAVGDTGDKDHRRVVTALKAIAEGTDLETYLDVDDVLRYLAVHIFSVNDDSLSGSMAHNYYLYESGGRLTILPWDYNLAFGGMGGGDATSVVNSAIDDAFTITSFFDTLLEQEGDRYHAYLRQLVTEYVQGGGFDAFYTRTRSQLDALVQDDPTAFYSYEEYTAAADALYDLVQRRAQSIAGQLDGTIPSTEAGQQGSDALIDASSIDLSSLGSMMGGGGPGDFGDFDPAAVWDGAAPAQAAPTDGAAPTQEGTSAGTDAAEDGTTAARPAQGGGPGGAPPDRSDASSDGGETAPQGPGRPGGSSDTDTSGTSRQNLILYAVSAGVLLIALAIALRYRRRPD